MLSREAAAANALAAAGRGRRVGILFGPERTGLTNDELLLADALVSYPGQPGLRLAQPGPGRAAVRLRVAPAGSATSAGARAASRAREPATKAEVAGLVEHLVRELDAVDFFRAEERRGSLIRTDHGACSSGGSGPGPRST